MNFNQLNNHLKDFNLSFSPDTGGVVWKNDNGLQIGIIVGKDSAGERYVICNKSALRIFAIQSLKSFEKDKYCYFDIKEQLHIRYETALMAFNLLYDYTKYNKKRYPLDFKIALPILTNTQQKKNTKEFSKGLSTVVYRATLLHNLEKKLRTGLVSTKKSFLKNCKNINRQFKETVFLPLPTKVKATEE